MKRLGKFLLIAAVVLVVILAAGSWALNRWLQSPEGHARIENEIGRAMRMPLKLGKLSFSAWSGVTAEGISVPAVEGNFFEAQSLSAEHRFSSLLRGRIVLGDVRIVQPRVRLVESPDGKWRLPELPAKAPIVTPAAVAATPPTAPPAAAPPATPPKPKKSIGISIGKIVIEDASAELIDKQRLPVAALKGLNATFHDVSEKSSAGEISLGSIVAPGYATVGEIRGKTEHRDKTVTVRILAANVCKGTVAGEITYAPGAPLSASLSLDNVDIGLAGKEARKRMRNASGILTGNIQLAGINGGAKAMTGQGSLVLRSGRCTEIELIRQIGEILQYAALAGFEVREARANFRVASERIFLSPLDVSLHPLGMSLTGGVGFDGAVELTGILSAPRNIVQRTGLVSAQFSPPDANDRQAVQFDIKGTLDQPKQNLAAQLTGTKDRKLQRIIAAESILSTLFGKKVDQAKPADPKAIPPAPPVQVRP